MLSKIVAFYDMALYRFFICPVLEHMSPLQSLVTWILFCPKQDVFGRIRWSWTRFSQIYGYVEQIADIRLLSRNSSVKKILTWTVATATSDNLNFCMICGAYKQTSLYARSWGKYMTLHTEHLLISTSGTPIALQHCVLLWSSWTPTTWVVIHRSFRYCWVRQSLCRWWPKPRS